MFSFLYNKVKNNVCKRSAVLVAQYSLGIVFVGLCAAGEYHYVYVLQSELLGPPLTEISVWLDALSVVLLISLSVTTPWHLAVDPVDSSFTCCIITPCSRQRQRGGQQLEEGISISESTPLIAPVKSGNHDNHRKTYGAAATSKPV